MNACILLVMASVATPMWQGTDGPTHVSRPMLSQGSGQVSYEDTQPPQPIAGDILWDQLDMARNCTYTTGNGNACAGVRALGGLYGLQMCDDFVLDAECTITEVTGAFLTFFGAPPAGGANVTFYQDAGCSPLDAFFAADCHAVAVPIPFRDCRFGLQGMYVTATLSDGGITLPPGRWFVDIQPEDETGEGDWYYQVRDNANVPTGCDSHMRDSRPNDPCCTQGLTGYGFSNWTSAGAAGFGAGDAAFQIVGKCGGAACSGREAFNTAKAKCPAREKIVAKGNGVPGDSVQLSLFDDQDVELSRKVRTVNSRGNWSAVFLPIDGVECGRLYYIKASFSCGSVIELLCFMAELNVCWYKCEVLVDCNSGNVHCKYQDGKEYPTAVVCPPACPAALADRWHFCRKNDGNAVDPDRCCLTRWTNTACKKIGRGGEPFVTKQDAGCLP